MLRIFVMAVIFIVEIFSSVVFAKLRIAVLPTENQQNALPASFNAGEYKRAAEYVIESLFDSGKFLIFDLEAAEINNVEMPELDYLVANQLNFEPTSRANKFKIVQRIDFVKDNTVIWSSEASKTIKLQKADMRERLNLENVIIKLTDKNVARLIKDIDSGALILE